VNNLELFKFRILTINTFKVMSKKYICLVCGYVHEGDSAPEECPLCYVGPEDFKEITDEE
jgi:rubrerythrin